MVTKKTKAKTSKKKTLGSKLWSLTKKGYAQGSKVVSKTLDYAEGIATKEEARKKGRVIGEMVIINNGVYSGKKLVIIGFVAGGVRGRLIDSGEITNIRYGGFN
jgi:hypothetical protein